MRPVALVLLLAATGCADGEARVFAATLHDAAETTCRGVSRHAAFEPELLEDLAEDLEDAYASAALASPPTPFGRVLHLHERDDAVHAWFDAPGAAGDPVPFAHPGAVYRGPPRDGYVEGRFAVTLNLDEDDEDAGLELCGDRLLAEGVLSLTDGDGLEGRIRWRELHYVDAVPSRCLAWIECARDVLVDGLPL